MRPGRPVIPLLTRVLTRGLMLALSLLVWGAARRLQRVAVEGDSMEPLLQHGDRLILLKGATVRLGDVVAAPGPREPERPLVKRVARFEGGLVWLEGTNPGRSTDSRHFGPVPLASVKGRAVYRYAPAGRAGRL